MKKKNIVILAVGLCLAVGVGLYYSHIQKNKEVSFTIDGENWSAEGTGSTAVIMLPANPTTGYEWSIESVEGPVSVSLDYVEDEHDAETVGVGGTELVIVKAEGEGISELVMKYARNWESGETERICRFEIVSDKRGNIQSISQTELDVAGGSSEETAAVSIIGGADGPTSIFLAGKLGDGDTANSDTIPLVMIDGFLYFLTGESDMDGRCGNMDGEITETVDGSEVPTKDNQSNFGSGYGYQYVDGNQLDVYMPYGNPDEWRWMRFLKIGAEAEWEVSWETFHGALQPGHYRLVKSVMDFREAGDYTDYNLAVEFDIQERAEKGTFLSEPPVLKLQDALSSTYEKFEVKSGNYTWYCKTENEGEMKGGIACGSGPLEEVQGREKLRVPRYNRLDEVPYTSSWETAPDYLTIREYSIADMGNTNATPFSEKTYDEIPILEIRPDCIYEIIARWEEDKLEKCGFYGEASYVVVTES